MPHDSSPTPDDLSYLRSLAEAGRNAPLAAGPYLLAGGGTFAFASVAIGLAEVGMLPYPTNSVAVPVMIGALLAFGLILAMLRKRDAGRAQNDTNRAVGAVWTAAGLGIFFYFVAVQVASWRMGSFALTNSITLVVLLLYGAAWLVTALVARQNWMFGVAAVTALSMMLVAATLGTSATWFAYAAALVLSGVLPGAHLMRLSAAHRA